MRRLSEIITIILIALLAAALGISGIEWGLPSNARNSCYFSGPDDHPRISELEVRHSADLYREFSVEAPRERSTFNAIRSCHPDEHYVLKGLANMDPRRGDFTSGLFGWPSLIFYIEGLALAVTSFFGYVTLTRDLAFYFANPDEIAKMYLVGRFMVVLFGTATAVVLYCWGRDCYNRGTGILAGVMISVLPLTTVHMHYMTGDIPMLFFVSLGLYFCSRSVLSSRARWPILAGLALGLAVSAKYKAVILLPLILVAVGAREMAKGRSMSDAVLRMWRLPALAGIAIALSVFLLLNLSVVRHASEFWRVFSGEIGSVAMNVGEGVTRGGDWFRRIPAMIGAAFAAPGLLLVHCTGPIPIVLALGACIRAVVDRSRRDLLPAIGFVLVYLTMGFIGTVYGRHMMPLLPMVALLSARQALVAWQQVPVPKLRSYLTVGLVALLVGTSLWRSIGYCRLFAALDVRLEAARWISSHVPTGASIGVPEIPWQYDTPPINERKYEVLVAGYDVEKLRALRPEYYLVSSRHKDPILRKPTPESSLFWRELRSTRKYVAVRVFERMPFVYEDTQRAGPTASLGLACLGLQLYNADAPEDMRYANPQITVFRRADIVP